MSPREYAPLLVAALAVIALAAGASTFGSVRGLDGASPHDDAVDPEAPPSDGSGGAAGPDAPGGDGSAPDAAEAESDPSDAGGRSAPAALALVAAGLLTAAGLLRRLAAGDGDPVVTADEADPDPTPPPDGDPVRPAPDDGVAAAWLALARHVAGREWPRRTPGEVAAGAREAGLPADAVADLRDLFERVRYGDAPATPDREARAGAALDRLSDRETGEGDP